MPSFRFPTWLKHGLTFGALAAAVAGSLPARAAPFAGDRKQFASPRFESVWRSSDEAVRQAAADRSWTWGPAPWFDYREFYKQSPNGLRLVQYFDKARMEINDPASTAGPLAGVTNGLLPVELISGRVKLGDGIGDDQNLRRAPAAIPVAGDPLNENPDAPLYESFRSVATTDNAYRDQSRLGQRAGATFAKSGAIGFREDLAAKPGTEIVVYESVTGHNVPRVFDDFRSRGPVPAIAAFGQPITDPYWIVARVGGQSKDVLVQIFERRVITYTPSNPPAFQVEMGNVGQHYFRWRYPQLGALGQPWTAEEPSLAGPIRFATRRDGGAFRLYETSSDGSYQVPIGNNPGTPLEVIPHSVQRAYWYEQWRIFGESRIDGRRQLVVVPFRFDTAERVLRSDADDYHAAVSPDGAKLAFVSNRDGNPELYLVNLSLGIAASATPTRLTETTGCANQYPSWLPDGSGLVYESNCRDNRFAIYRAALSYTQDMPTDLVVARLISPAAPETLRLTTNSGDDRSPRVSPDGSAVVFTATRDGNPEIYRVGIDGGPQVRLTTSAAMDDAASWSPDGSQLVFNSNRDGDHELFRMSRDGSGQTQITNNTADDGYAIWWQ